VVGQSLADFFLLLAFKSPTGGAFGHTEKEPSVVGQSLADGSSREEPTGGAFGHT
jgi:hypothetical protein